MSCMHTLFVYLFILSSSVLSSLVLTSILILCNSHYLPFSVCLSLSLSLSFSLSQSVSLLSQHPSNVCVSSSSLSLRPLHSDPKKTVCSYFGTYEYSYYTLTMRSTYTPFFPFPEELRIDSIPAFAPCHKKRRRVGKAPAPSRQVVPLFGKGISFHVQGAP